MEFYSDFILANAYDRDLTYVKGIQFTKEITIKDFHYMHIIMHIYNTLAVSCIFDCDCKLRNVEKM